VQRTVWASTLVQLTPGLTVSPVSLTVNVVLLSAMASTLALPTRAVTDSAEFSGALTRVPTVGGAIALAAADAGAGGAASDEAAPRAGNSSATPAPAANATVRKVLVRGISFSL
jgi:hypothetical protein